MGRLFALSALALLAIPAGTAEAASAPQRAPDVEEAFVDGADGVRLFYRRVGRGRDVVVYLHGGPGSNFRGNGEYMDALARGRTVIMYDQRGSGRSTIVTDPEQLEAEDQVRDLEAFRSGLGIRRMSLIGLSWGSGLATLYAAQYPQRVRRMILVSPISPTRAFAVARAAHLDGLLGPESIARREAIHARLPLAGDEETIALCREINDLIFRLYLAAPTPGKLQIAARRCDIPPAAIRNRPIVEAATMRSLGEWDFRPLLQRLRMPVLVVEGDSSHVPLDATRTWVSDLPNARLLLVEQAGHEFFLDQPERFAAAADRFLSGRWPAR